RRSAADRDDRCAQPGTDATPSGDRLLRRVTAAQRDRGAWPGPARRGGRCQRSCNRAALRQRTGRRENAGPHRHGRALTAPSAGARRRLLRLARILDGLADVELDVPELAVLPLDLADVDVLDDVARLRVDQDLATRALEELSLHRREQRVAAARARGRGDGV